MFGVRLGWTWIFFWGRLGFYEKVVEEARGRNRSKRKHGGGGDETSLANNLKSEYKKLELLYLRAKAMVPGVDGLKILVRYLH